MQTGAGYPDYLKATVKGQPVVQGSCRPQILNRRSKFT